MACDTERRDGSTTGVRKLSDNMTLNLRFKGHLAQLLRLLRLKAVIGQK